MELIFCSIQTGIKKAIVEEDDAGFDYDNIQFVAGFDISLSKEEGF
jgi:deoxyinosine 3'endonuclease (endonuclease V)